MNDYILEFENLNHEMTLYNLALPDILQAFKILGGAMVTDSQHGTNHINTSNEEISSSNSFIKEADAFYTTQRKYKDKNKKLSLLTIQGKVSRCTISDSKRHWEKN